MKYLDARQTEMSAQHQREHDNPAALPKPTQSQRNYKIKAIEKKKPKGKKTHNSIETAPWSQHTLLLSISVNCI